MLFNSIPFLVLFVITYILYWNSNIKYKKYVLLASSIIFYSYHNFYLTFHFLGIILLNFYLSLKIFEKKRENLPTDGWIKLTVVLNLINLGFFKYFYFFSGLIYTLTGIVSVKEFSSTVHIFLPLAISFYTFQIIALQIDIHRNKIVKTIPFLDYLIFILFFPQLIAGPIMRSEEFLPKLDHPEIDFHSMKKGIYLILTGLIKKVVIADNIGTIVNPLYMNSGDYSFESVLLGNLGFIIQVYCDFSGYSDIARGLAFLLGFEIPVNFRGPFFSKSFTEFWQRWHITLSTWLKDYLYISLGGNRKGFTMAIVNLLITMGLGGLWHGADIAYVLWGLFLGILIAIERIMDHKGIQIPDQAFLKPFKFAGIIFAFTLSGIFFRSGIYGEKSLSIIFTQFQSIFTLKSGLLIYRHEELILYILLGFFFNFIEYKDRAFLKSEKMSTYLLPAYSFFVLILMGLYGDGGGDFIYFQF